MKLHPTESAPIVTLILISFLYLHLVCRYGQLLPSTNLGASDPLPFCGSDVMDGGGGGT